MKTYSLLCTATIQCVFCSIRNEWNKILFNNWEGLCNFSKKIQYRITKNTDVKEFLEYFSRNQRPKIYPNQSSKLKGENRCRPV